MFDVIAHLFDYIELGDIPNFLRVNKLYYSLQDKYPRWLDKLRKNFIEPIITITQIIIGNLVGIAVNIIYFYIHFDIIYFELVKLKKRNI